MTRSLSPTAIAEAHQLSKSFIYKEIAAGRLPAIRFGRSVRVLESDLARYLDDHREGGAS